jgi:hypothetical protein
MDVWPNGMQDAMNNKGQMIERIAIYHLRILIIFDYPFRVVVSKHVFPAWEHTQDGG